MEKTVKITNSRFCVSSKEFLEAGKEYKVEIIAEESSGNRTAIEVPFTTEE